MKTNKVLNQITQAAMAGFAALVFQSAVFPAAMAQSFQYTTGLMITNCENHTATLLPNGTVLVAGGITNADTQGVILASAELYYPNNGNWIATSAMVNARNHHTATLLTNGKVLVAGGQGSSAILSSVELYNPDTGKWASTNSMRVPRAVHTATLLPNGKVLVAGGTTDGINALSSAELYDPASRTWTLTGPMTAARAGHSATLLPNGKVLVAGGGTGHHFSTPTPGAELYDPATGKWTVTGSPNTARSQQATATLLPNGKVLLVAGCLGKIGPGGNTINTNSAELYDPATGVWTLTGSLTTGARHGNTATLLSNGNVLIAGGEEDDGDVHSSAETYNPITGAWTATDAMEDALEWQTATLLPNGNVLIAGGCGVGGGSPSVNTAEIYNSTLAPLALNTASLSNATNSTVYYQMLNVTGGLPPYSWTNRSGSLPPGLALLASGLLSGTPTAMGSYIFTVEVTDAWSETATQVLMLQVVWPPDTNRPALSITNPTKTGAPWSKAGFSVAGTAKDKVAVTNVCYSLNGGAWCNAVTTNLWTNWLAAVTLVPGTNTIAAYAINAGGNASPVTNTSVFFVVSNQLQIGAIGLGTIAPNYSNAWLNIGQNYSITSSPASGFAAGNWVIATNGLAGAATAGRIVHFMMASNLTLAVNFVDTNRPTVSITNLVAGQRVSNALYTVKGKASDNWEVAAVNIQLNNNGWTTAAGTNNWSALLNLVPGTNTVQAYAVDNSGNVSLTNSVALDYVLSAPLVVQVLGAGFVTPNYNGALLAIGTNYTMKATASNGFTFYYWGGGVTMTTNKSLTFTMASNLTIIANFADVTKPVATITYPAANLKWSSTNITVIGKASDNVGVAKVWCQINRGGWTLAQTGNGFTNWTAANLPVRFGTNIIQACAEDAAGNISTTNTVQFLGVVAPASLAGYAGTLKPAVGGKELVLAWSEDTWSQTGTSGDTNADDYCAGTYAYFQTGPNTAVVSNMDIGMFSALGATNTTTLNLTFTSATTANCTWTNGPSSGAGTLTLSPVTELAPATVAGMTVHIQYGPNFQRGATIVFYDDGKWQRTEQNGNTLSGVYAWITFSPTVAILQFNDTDSRNTSSDHLGELTYVEVTFTSATGGQFFNANYYNPTDETNPDDTKWGSFTMQP